MHILILTARYPFGRSEAYLEAEMEFAATETALAITVMPYQDHHDIRPYPIGIRLDDSLIRGRTFRRRVFLYAKSIFTESTRAELINQWGRGMRWSPRLTLRTLINAGHVARIEKALRSYLEEHPETEVVYTYWHGPATYAAARLKSEGYDFTLITRAHRVDVYEDHRRPSHIPFHRENIDEIDKIYPVSQHAADYVNEVYGAAQVEVNRLGITVPELRPMTQGRDRSVALLSVGDVIKRKRLGLTVNALAEVATRRPDILFQWTHVGGGPGYDEIHGLAQRRLARLANVECELTGALAHGQVIERLKSGTYDLYVSTSESEGISVAAMEAMAYGIIPIVTNVGGTDELVGPGEGWLMAEHPSQSSVAECLEKAALAVVDGEEVSVMRQNAHAKVRNDFSAESNYREFWHSVALVVRVNSSQLGDDR